MPRSPERPADLRCAAALFFTAMLAYVAPCPAQEVTAATDKTAYASGEKIAITLSNNLKESIFSRAAGRTPEFAITNCERKRSQWSWDAYRLRCPWPECEKGSDAPREIKAGKSVSFAWKPHVFADKKDRALLPGLYRLTVMYQTRKGTGPDAWLYNTVKSNEFTVE